MARAKQGTLPEVGQYAPPPRRSIVSPHRQPDGNPSWGPRLLDADGNLYGTTYGGGGSNAGTVFRLTPNAVPVERRASFTTSPAKRTGELSFAGLVADQHGNLYGTTFNGGGSCLTEDHLCGRLGQQSAYGPAGNGWTQGVGLPYSYC